MSQDKALGEYSTQDLIAFIDTLTNGENMIPPAMRNKIKQVITEGNLSGEDLTVSNKEALEDWGFARHMTAKLYKALQTIPQSSSKSSSKPQAKGPAKPKDNEPQRDLSDIDRLVQAAINERDGRNANCDPNSNNATSKINDQGFKVTFQYNGSKTTYGRFTLDSTVGELRQHLVDTEFGGTAKNFELICMGDVLKDTDIFGKVGITSPFTDVYISIKNRGGASDSEDEKQINNNNKIDRKRIPNFKDKRLIPTLEPDCIMGYDEKNKIRVKMPCGHSFDPSTIYSIVKMSIEVHKYDKISCPMLKCNKEWDFGLVGAACDLSKEESTNINRILMNRKLVSTGDYRFCEECGSIGKKPTELNMKRLRCSNVSCTRGDFCWICGKKWIGGGWIVCGNRDCPSAKVNDALNTAKLVVPKYRKDEAKCPDLRACPRCFSLTRYTEACKHMKCWNCQESFCFMCLAMLDKSTGKWGCVAENANSPSSECAIAKRQVLK